MTDIVDTAGAARRTGVSEVTLRKRRMNGDGPAYVKLGRTVRYRLSDLDDWLAENVRRRTATQSEANDSRSEAA
jgi:predicted DNA-binding transcriptional regulator AlpA